MGKILIAEDDKFLGQIYEVKLTKEGYEIIRAVNGEEAVAKALSEKPSLILLDLVMPKKDGFAVLTEIKANPETQNIPVIIMSNLGQESDKKKGLELGAVDYLVKANLSIEDMMLKIKTHMQ
ncbi:response regulator [Candidatus Peregrinibacteria bacterium]|jgi:two-component system, OmpR family, alkaline phosphatase synthesis response regulator PhoP|nr:response regulator [Candidatus Peregrinibacteria bacterium]MBT4632241.1 response regulator [Candidatus Peregrinibacteria bacterium]MBT5824348.1 response regulator [Candidatus Peregrinibacteria bacterium]